MNIESADGAQIAKLAFSINDNISIRYEKTFYRIVLLNLIKVNTAKEFLSTSNRIYTLQVSIGFNRQEEKYFFLVANTTFFCNLKIRPSKKLRVRQITLNKLYPSQKPAIVEMRLTPCRSMTSACLFSKLKTVIFITSDTRPHRHRALHLSCVPTPDRDKTKAAMFFFAFFVGSFAFYLPPVSSASVSGSTSRQGQLRGLQYIGVGYDIIKGRS